MLSSAIPDAETVKGIGDDFGILFVVIDIFFDLFFALGSEYGGRTLLDDIAYAVEFSRLPSEPEFI